MKHRDAAKLLKSSLSRSEMANFFLSPVQHPDLILDILIEKKKTGSYKGPEPGPDQDDSYSGLSKTKSRTPRPKKKRGSVSSYFRWAFPVCLALFLSCAVVPNHIMTVAHAKPLEIDSTIQGSKEIETINGAAEIMWKGARKFLGPEIASDTFMGQFINTEWAGLVMIDKEGNLRAIARNESIDNVNDWMSRYTYLEDENDSLRSGLEALKKAKDSKKIYLELNLDDNVIFVKMSSQTLYEFPVVTGKGYKPRSKFRRRRFQTPRGIMTVKKKERNPRWNPPSWHWTERGRDVPERRYSIGRVLGKYRLNLGNSYGIHGTSSGRIGRPGKRSHGCIRMNKKDLEIVFKLADIGTEVYVY
jgi:L,D-transpeptidase catalytic domain